MSFNKKLSLAFLFIGFTIPQIVYGTDMEDLYKKGMIHYNQKSYREAAILFEEAAKTNPKALNALAAMYQQGEYFQQDYKQAEKYYLKAFEGGVKNAGFNLGLMYKSEKSGLKNYAKALSYFQPLAQEGNERATKQVQQMCNKALQEEASKWDPKTITDLGKICYHGSIIAQDVDKAKSLFQKAMTLGSEDAQFCLAVLYVEGKGVPQDFTTARKLWYALAQKGNTDAMINIGQTYTNVMWPTGTRSENIQKGVQWFKTAANKGNTQAMILLAEAHTTGIGALKNTTHAKELLEKAEKQGASVLGHLGAVYLAEGNNEKALKLWKEGASKDDACSLYNLGVIYCNGQGVEKDLKKAGEYLQKSANLGYPMAQQFYEQYKKYFN